MIIGNALTSGNATSDPPPRKYPGGARSLTPGVPVSFFSIRTKRIRPRLVAGDGEGASKLRRGVS